MLNKIGAECTMFVHVPTSHTVLAVRNAIHSAPLWCFHGSNTIYSHPSVNLICTFLLLSFVQNVTVRIGLDQIRARDERGVRTSTSSHGTPLNGYVLGLRRTDAAVHSVRNPRARPRIVARERLFRRGLASWAPRSKIRIA